MNAMIAFLLLPLAGLFIIPRLDAVAKGWAAYAVLFINALISGYFAIQSLTGNSVEVIFAGSLVTGEIPVRIDALAGWFILIINIVFLTGGFYALFYLKAYSLQKNKLTMHFMVLMLQHASMLSVCAIQNSLVFLMAWEIMAITSFVLIIFENEEGATIKAGINYLVQAHFSVIFLMIGFLWVASKTGSYDFEAITAYTASIPSPVSFMLFVLFFVGFAIKAGFVPFHTWLPHAHPAAPSHISGMMSGVTIKTGIFGLLKFIFLIRTDLTTVGYFILFFALITGIYGVMLAIIQHNLKKLLAYHSIENIGIIGIGIGIGCIGLGSGNQLLATLGFAGALLHTLNHALFKSLLFYTAGNIYQATHTMEIEKLGGLVKRMPHTTVLFLIAAVAICGIPPFNGFISEFILYTGLYRWISDASLLALLTAIFSTAGLALIGGLALLCFTKAFGIIFLGNSRHVLPESCCEVPFIRLIPLYLLALIIVLIGLFPSAFIALLTEPVSLFTDLLPNPDFKPMAESFGSLKEVSLGGWLFVALVTLVFGLRYVLTRNRNPETGATWGCGYAVTTSKQQYTAGSFVRTYTKLFAPFLVIKKHEDELHGIFPGPVTYHTHPYDKLEETLIDRPLKANKSFMSRFVFLNNGKLQFYILYGVIFILSVLSLPFVYDKISTFFQFLKQM